MLKKSRLKFVLALSCLAMGFTSFAAGKEYPMGAMVQREQSIHTFVPVGDIWQADNSFDQRFLLTKIAKAQPLSIDYTKLAYFMEQRYPAIQLLVPKTGGGTYTINLVKYDIFSSGFKVQENVNGEMRDFAYTPGVYYRGTVDGIDGSIAGFSFFKNEVYGIFSIPNEGNYNLVPNTMVGKYYDYNQHYLLYNDMDLLIPKPAPCGTDQLPEINRGGKNFKTTTTPNNNVYNNCTEVRIYELADHSTYVTKGSNSTNVTNYVTALFNNESIIYKDEGIIISLKYLGIHTTADNYASLSGATSALPYLNRFGHNTLNNLNGADLAVMLSTQNGNLGGVAWLQTLCFGNYQVQQGDTIGPYCYCNIDGSSGTATVPTYSWDVNVTTHEMGHIIGSPHTHRCCWNPPGTGTTAIDGCYAVSGYPGASMEPNSNCPIPTPSTPGSAGGTIMSYCHLINGVGVNLANGFGQQPGDTMRHFVSSNSPCLIAYNLTPVISKSSKTLLANRECTDPSGITYYFNDNNTTDQSDDTLVLMMFKNGNNIGSLNNSGFTVSANTVSGYGNNSGVSTNFPTGTSESIIGTTSIAMKRYWRIVPTAQPTSAVEVMFPFLSTDTADVHGSMSGYSLPISSFLMYKLNSAGIDPNPVNNFPGATSSNMQIYTYDVNASSSTWSISNYGFSTTRLAHMQMTYLSGGGTGFATYGNVSVENVAGKGNIVVYPNPINDHWMISIPDGITDALTLQLFSADGKMITVQALHAGNVNTVSTTNLATGLYFYRIVGANSMYTGNVLKQ